MKGDNRGERFSFLFLGNFELNSLSTCDGQRAVHSDPQAARATCQQVVVGRRSDKMRKCLSKCAYLVQPEMS